MLWFTLHAKRNFFVELCQFNSSPFCNSDKFKSLSYEVELKYEKIKMNLLDFLIINSIKER